jgi:hypothetical protein
MKPRIDVVLLDCAILAVGTAGLIIVALAILRSSWSIDLTYFNEGWNAYYEAAALHGNNVYLPTDGFTFNDYPPLSFLVIGALARLVGGDVVTIGRLVSIGSLIVVAISAGIIVHNLIIQRDAERAKSWRCDRGRVSHRILRNNSSLRGDQRSPVFWSSRYDLCAGSLHARPRTFVKPTDHRAAHSDCWHDQAQHVGGAHRDSARRAPQIAKKSAAVFDVLDPRACCLRAVDAAHIRWARLGEHDQIASLLDPQRDSAGA